MPENIGDLTFLHDGRLMKVHGSDECSGPNCCIHNPSDHPLKDAPLSWRSDHVLMERICEHGIGHPDPDDLDHWRRQIGHLPQSEKFLTARAEHSCDGCCSPDETPQESFIERVLGQLDSYLQDTWLSGNPHDGPWPDDPDGGEMRVFSALHNIFKVMQKAEADGKVSVALIRLVEAASLALDRRLDDVE